MNAAEFTAKVKDHPRPVIVDLWAPWCGPCRAMEPALKQAAKKYEGQVDVWKINADESPDVVRSLGVMGIPTTIGFANGQEVIRKTGLQSPESLDVLFDATLHQRSAAILPPAPADRWIRTLIGLVLLAIGITYSQWFAVGLGGLVLFSAFYDRCPIFRAVYPRVKALFTHKDRPAGT